MQRKKVSTKQDERTRSGRVSFIAVVRESFAREHEAFHSAGR